MNTLSTLRITGLLTAALLVGPAPAQGPGNNPNNSVIAYIQTLPLEAISPAEAYLLTHMREEEKLARDVYTTLHQYWQLPIFDNIARAEQSHMDLVAYVMQRYQLPDPVQSNQVGVFSDPVFTQLYQLAVNFGQASPMHALFVGAVIEDLDIYDLNEALFYTDNRDVDTVWQNLQKGSRNHMRAFYPQLSNQGLVYFGIFLSNTAIQAIVTTPVETGAVDENGVPL